MSQQKTPSSNMSLSRCSRGAATGIQAMWALVLGRRQLTILHILGWAPWHGRIHCLQE